MPSDSIGLLEIVKAWRDQGVEVTCMSGIVK
jgi:aryl carrier-like protein